MRLYLFFYFVSVLACGTSYAGVISRPDGCALPAPYLKEIKGYSQIVKKILDTVINGTEKGKTFDELATFVDKFGNRIVGSQNLENAIDYMVKRLSDEKLQNVHTENAPVPHWVRGNEYAQLIAPRKQNLAMLGLGGSIATPKEGITAQVVVVNSFDDLKSKAAEIPGKIVVYNQDWVSYGVSVMYRVRGAVEASKLGAKAALIRSVTPFSINSPHTGWQSYAANVTDIPVASITVEDAQMLHRMYLRGEALSIHLYMEAQNLPMAISRNTVAEIEGKTDPEQIVLVSGHLDSWDVGQGAMDDGGGAFISWRALAVLRSMNLQPRRTLRAVLWTGEEPGTWGAQAYYNDHKNNKDNFNLMMESDIGTFQPLGLTYSGTNTTAQCIVQEVLNLFESIAATKLDLTKDGPDIGVWEAAGVPGSSLVNQNEEYFYFHHSNGDTMTVEDTHNLDLCTAFWAASAYVFSDLSFKLPR